jgi:hypothetical protein
MHSRDIRDLVGGALLLLLGASVAIYAFLGLDIGSVREMGPGMVPVALGVLLTLFGAAIAVPALYRPGSPIDVDLRSVVAISIGIAAFAAATPTIGIVPAIILLTVISSFAAREHSVLVNIALAIGLAVLVWAIFRLGLGVPMQMFRNPL